MRKLLEQNIICHSCHLPKIKKKVDAANEINVDRYFYMDANLQYI